MEDYFPVRTRYILFLLHLLFLRSWDVFAQLKLTATIPHDLFCPNVYEMIGAGSCENCVIYFLSKKAVDRHKKIHALGGILVSQSLYLDEVKIRISVFKIQLSTECQSSRTSLNSQFVTMDFFVYAYIKQERGYAPTCTDVYSQGRRVKIFNFLGYAINKWVLNICLCKFAGNELLVRFYKKVLKTVITEWAASFVSQIRASDITK